MHARLSTFAPLRSRRAFTLVEIILVVVIILTLAAVVIPRLTGTGRSQKIKITKIGFTSVKTALQNFETYASRFPTTEEGLEALITKPSGLSDDNWDGPYLDEFPKDGFGNPIEYRCPSDHGKDFDLISSGPDGKMGTEDDITNYEDKSKSKPL